MRFSKRRLYTDDLEKDCVCGDDLQQDSEENFKLITNAKATWFSHKLTKSKMEATGKQQKNLYKRIWKGTRDTNKVTMEMPY